MTLNLSTLNLPPLVQSFSIVETGVKLPTFALYPDGIVRYEKEVVVAVDVPINTHVLETYELCTQCQIGYVCVYSKRSAWKVPEDKICSTCKGIYYMQFSNY